MDAGTEEWVLCPSPTDLESSSSALQWLSAEGWVLQIEAAEHGYHLGSEQYRRKRSQSPGFRMEDRTPEPSHHRQHAGGVIPVLGESFDPLGFLKRTPEAPVLP